MKTTQALLFVLAAASSSVFAAPALRADGGVATTPGADMTPNPAWTGDNLLRRRAGNKNGKKGTAEACESGKDECQEGLGCYGCWNHTTVCQKGPGSNECCFRAELGPICQIMPIGK